MSARRLVQLANGTATVIFLRPVVVMAARVMGPGPARLRLVKLAHELSCNGLAVVPPVEGGQGLEGATAVQPTTRAA